MALGDVLLVLLGDAPGTPHDLQRRHNAAFGPEERVDISRVSWTLTRHERLGLVRAVKSGPAKQRRFELTDAGCRHQRTWLLRLPPDAAFDDVRTRVLLAVAAADRATFETVVAVCLAHLELARLGLSRPDAPLSPDRARAELSEAVLGAQFAWLQGLRHRPRDRDRDRLSASEAS